MLSLRKQLVYVLERCSQFQRDGTRAPPGGGTEPDLEVVRPLLLRPHPHKATLSTGLRKEAELNLTWGREGRFLGRQGCDLRAEPGQG